MRFSDTSTLNEAHVLLSHLHADRRLDLPGLFVRRRYHLDPGPRARAHVRPPDTGPGWRPRRRRWAGELDDFADIFENTRGPTAKR